MKAIVVLGTKIIQNKQTGVYTPSLTLKMRLDMVHQVFIDYGDDHTIIVTSGGQPNNPHIAESAVMKKYLIQKGIPSCKIFEENKSNNTIENCINTYKLLDLLYERRLTLQELIPNSRCNYYGTDFSGEIPPFTTIYLVTSDFHVPRSKIIFEHFNVRSLQVIPIGSPTPENVASRYLQNEKRIDITKCLTLYNS